MAATATVESKASGKQQGEFENRPGVRIWKPSKSGTGSAALFEFNDDNKSIFLTMIPQKENGSEGKFDNERKISAKLGLNDIGEILCVLTRRTEGLGQKNEKGFFSGLYHQSPSGSSQIGLSWVEATDKYPPGFMLSLSVKRETNEARYTVKLTLGEAMQLEKFFSRFIVELF